MARDDDDKADDKEIKNHVVAVKDGPPESADPAPKAVRIVKAHRKEGARQFARVQNGQVAEIIEEIEDINQEWHPDILKTLVDISGLSDEDRPKPGYLHKGAKRFAEPEYKPTPEMQRNSAFRSGPVVNGSRFSVTAAEWQRMTEVAQHVAMFDEFPDESDKLKWPSDPPVTFDSPGVFLETFKKLSKWRHKWNQFDGKGHPPDEKVD